MLTSINGYLKGFFYDPDQYSREGGGYLRTSSREYSLKSGKLNNKFIHLTNDAV
jgi:Tubulin-tyrosine ligase family